MKVFQRSDLRKFPRFDPFVMNDVKGAQNILTLLINVFRNFKALNSEYLFCWKFEFSILNSKQIISSMQNIFH